MGTEFTLLGSSLSMKFCAKTSENSKTQHKSVQSVLRIGIGESVTEERAGYVKFVECLAGWLAGWLAVLLVPFKCNFTQC